MPRRITHVFQVIVLTAGADTALGACSTRVIPGLTSQKNILELVHARVSKQQCRVISRYQ